MTVLLLVTIVGMVTIATISNGNYVNANIIMIIAVENAAVALAYNPAPTTSPLCDLGHTT